jgi:hypothetical protein
LNIQLHPLALEELEEQAAWYELRREGLGLEFVAETRGTLARLLDAPALGAPWPGVNGVRRLALASFPLFLVYVSDASTTPSLRSHT